MAATSTRRAVHDQYVEAHSLGSARWRALGTDVHLLATDPAAVSFSRPAVVGVLDQIDLAASRFRDDSELAAVNSAAGKWVQVSPLMCRALRVALDAAEWTAGRVDPTMGASLVALGYDRTFTAVAKDDVDSRITVRQVPGWHDVELDDEALRVRMPTGTRLDLGATAKGLAADLAADAAAAAGGCGVLVNLGGDISVAGDPPAGGWAINVGDTSRIDVEIGVEVEQVICLHDGGLATSSTRARRWRRGGVELHHIIDPRNGQPAAGRYRTVSVASSTCTLANAASTAAIILGDEAPSWLTERELPARLVDRDGLVRHVAGWPPPTNVSPS